MSILKYDASTQLLREKKFKGVVSTYKIFVANKFLHTIGAA